MAPVNSIGIMQGRVLPEYLDRLQIFPASRWELELAEISSLGFDCVELLYDRSLECRRIYFESKEAQGFLSEQNRKRRLPIAESMCVDYLASVSALTSRDRFMSHLAGLIETVGGTALKTLVIPFVEENEIRDRRSLDAVLQALQETGLADRAMKRDLALALEIPLPASEILESFSKFATFEYRVCLDLGNTRAMGLEPEKEIMQLGTRICHVHVKDRPVGGPNVLLGDGDVNFHETFRALRTVGYGGPLILETSYFRDPPGEALKNLRFVNAALEAVKS